MSLNTTSIDLDHALRAAACAADLGRDILLRYFGDLSQIRKKDQAGLVTEADLESEAAITDYLLKLFPDIPILAEEDSFKSGPTASRVQPTRWLIDPLDGTTNYVHRFPFFCVSIGLEVDGELVLGLVDAPKLGARYSAMKGGGAFKDGAPIKVSGRNLLKESLLATGFFVEDSLELSGQLEDLGKLVGKTQGMRRAGSAALDLCYVAEGVFDAYFETSLNPWDTAAGTVIVREAGGQVTDYSGLDHQPEMNSILASNKHIHQAVRQHLKT